LEPFHKGLQFFHLFLIVFASRWSGDNLFSGCSGQEGGEKIVGWIASLRWDKFQSASPLICSLEGGYPLAD
jgi:hypothetical protein